MKPVMTDAPARPRGPKPPIPVTVLTGFLGAGKTTLVNRMLRDAALANALVLVNEFGEIGIDHDLIEGVADGIVELSAGCLCCTIRGDLIATLEDMLRRLDNGRIKRFDRLILETTGLADPGPVLQTLTLHPYLMLRYRLDGVVTVVDAINGAATLDRHPESVKQAAVADVLVLTKTDLAKTAPELVAVAKLKQRLAGLAPGARLIEADALAIADLLRLGPFDPDGKGADVRRWLADAAVSAAEPHDHGDGAGGLDLNRHDASIHAFSLVSPTPMPAAAFELFLDLLKGLHGPRLLRVKGLVNVAEAAGPVVVHGVQHVFHPPVVMERWPDADRSTRIVFIVDGVPADDVRRLFDAFLRPREQADPSIASAPR